MYAETGTTSVSAGSCTPGRSSHCTLTITTTIGAHTFDVITYPVSQGHSVGDRAPRRRRRDAPHLQRRDPVRRPTVRHAEPGTNPGQTITLLGVADHVAFTGPTLTEFLNGDPTAGRHHRHVLQFKYTINDSYLSGGNQIVQPGNYDNGPVAIARAGREPGIVSMTPISQTAPPAATACNCSR